MKIFKTSLLAIVLLFSVASCSKDASNSDEIEIDYTIDLNLAKKTDWQMANEILVLVNDHRESIGMEAIQLDKSYASAYAVDHTDYMISMDQINHDNFGVRKAGLESRGAVVVGENVAYGYTSAEDVVNAWLNSPGHRAAIEGLYTHSGFGVMKSPEDRYYFTQLFYKK